MLKIKTLFVLTVMIFSSSNAQPGPAHEWEYADQHLEGSSRRRPVSELIVPILRRHSVGTYLATITNAPSPAIPIQPTLMSPVTKRAKLAGHE